MQQICTQCNVTFDVTDEDLAFYEHISPVFNGTTYSIPPPKRCPRCRQHARLAFRNHTALFARPSYPSGDIIYSMYPEDAPFPVMKNEDWFGDSWDALDYGMDFTTDKPFFAQLEELYKRVPRYTAVNNVRSENCDYCHNVSDIRNCYLTFNTSYAEDCLYGEAVWSSKDCIENSHTIESELCYDCTSCTRCFNLQSSFNCENCNDSFFLGNCRNCSNCFGCVNLRNKRYCIWNEQKTKEEYEAFIQTFDGTSYNERQRYNTQFEQMFREHPRPHTLMLQTEDCSGNYILNSRNVTESNFVQYGENLRYCFNVHDHCNDCQDFTFFGRSAELLYACCSCGINVTHLCFCYLCRSQSADLFYCMSCDACTNCFGCIGLWRKEYCIFNKQYTQEEYEALVPRIIAHMQETGEWGEFFPISLNATPYNRSIAYRYYPLTKDQAEALGYSWHEEDMKDYPGAIDAGTLPDGLPETDDQITVLSAQSGRPFRITSRELEGYRALRVPLPRETYEERMHRRAQKLGALELFDRTCAKTGKVLRSPYAPDAPYIIWDRDEYEREFQ